MLLRTTSTLVAATVVTALLATPTATAAVCHGCEEPELPGPGGPSCPTIAATTDPVVDTTNPKVGASASASTGVWNTNTKQITVIWYAGNHPVSTSQTFTTTAPRTVTYVPTASDHGKTIRLYVRGIGQDTQCVKGEYSNSTNGVATGAAPTATTAPSITGTPQVGSPLQATGGAWSLSIDTFDHAWSWSTGEPRGTGATYVPTAADLGKQLRLTVTAHRAGHTDGTATSTASAAVAVGPALSAGTSPTLTGAATFGETLTVDDGAWTPAATTVRRQWLRDGNAISGADGSTYQLEVADVGARITVLVTATRDGYADGSTTLDAGTVRAAAAPRWTAGKVGLKGTPKVKKKMKVALGAKLLRQGASAPDAVISYQWLRASKAIKSSTKKAHRIKKADLKKKLKVRITITQPGHAPLTITTKAVRIKNNGK